MNNKEKKLLEQQMITTIIYLLTLFVSLSLTYNDILNLDDKYIYNDELAEKIGITNRTIVLVLTLSYLYINYQNREIAKSKKKELKFSNLQLTASSLSTIAAIIVLYVVISSGKYTVISAGNPNL